MDPLSVTVSVATFLANCLTTVKSLSNLSSKYQHALVTISSIVSETTILGAYLAHVQQLLLINAPGVSDQGAPGVELRRTFDVALTACLITFSCLEEEVRSLARKAGDAADPEWKELAKAIWKDGIMTELLGQVHEQQRTMALLVQTLQMQSLSASNHFLSENRNLLQDMVTRSRSLRSSSFKELKVPESIFDGRPSGAFLDASSTVGSAEFDFDDDVVNSTVYRRAMARVQHQQSFRKRVRSVIEGDLIDFSELGSEEEYEVGEGASKDLEELLPRNSVRGMSPTMETLEEEPSDRTIRESPRKAASYRSTSSTPSFSPRVTGPVRSYLYPPMDHRLASPTQTTLASNAATADTNSTKSVETRSNLSESGRAHSPATITAESSSQVVNFSRKAPSSNLGSNSLRASSSRSESMTGFYDNEDATSSIAPTEDRDREPARLVPITSVPPRTAKRLEAAQRLEEQRTGIPPKAARRLGVDERVHPQRLAHIEETPHSDHSRPNSRTSGSSGDSRVKPLKSNLKNGSKPSTIESLAKIQALDWSQPWVIFWRLTPPEVQKPPNGYSIGLQEMWWRLLQLEENYQQSLEMLHDLIASSDASLPTCGITPLAIKKLQASHDKHLRQPMRACMVGPWTFDYPAIIKSFQLAHAHLVPLYERYAWDLPLVTFQVAAASGPSTSASRDLLSSIGPGRPTRYTCFRSPLTHICASFDTIQALYDGLHKGGPPSAPNYAQAVAPVREQLRSLVASCNRNILLRWDDLRRSNLFGSYPSRDIAHVMKELVFPPSQRRNIALLGLSSPTRAVISRADLHWKAKSTDSWSKCHAILLNNYLILASVSDTKGTRQHQVYHLISLKQIATTTMSPADTSDKASSKKPKAGKPIYHLYVRTPEFEHIIGFATLLHCLEWHEHLDVALRGEMMDMPTGISASTS